MQRPILDATPQAPSPPSAGVSVALPPGITEGELAVAIPLPAESAPARSSAQTFTRNSLLSIGRLFVSTAIGLVLPSFLAHKLPIATYAAWVLILQMSAYVGYLDFGIQTGIAKYVAEFEARRDTAGLNARASAGLALMVCASALGVVLTLLLAWNVPHLFHEMPAALYPDVRRSLIFVGVALSFGLLCSIFSSIFFGLQRFAEPMVISLVNRVLYTAVVLGSVYLHASLAVMGLLVALVHIVTGLLQFEVWRRYARHIRLSLRALDWSIVRRMLGYCSTLAIWTAGMLCVSGLDVTIIGRYDFSQTAFYSIATLPTNFVIAIMGAALAPLMPTASALSVDRTPQQMGHLLARATRYSSVLLVLSGVPLLVAGFWILRLWVGPVYAVHTIAYLRILVIANVLRNMCMPYASMLVATDSQKVAIAGATAEAVVNVTLSIYLARHIGAIGVAYGTLVGSVVSVSMHFALSMHYTQSKFSITRARLFLTGLARPALIALPSLLLARFWWSASAPTLSLPAWIGWAVSTLVIAWYLGIDRTERGQLVRSLTARLGRLGLRARYT